MATNKLANVAFQRLTAAKGLENVTAHELFSGKKVVVFALPGAFTPTCSTTHVPGYLKLAPALRKEGVDVIACVSVNDAFVMDAWKRDQGITDNNIEFLADGNADFTTAMGMDTDKSAIGFGIRSWRYSALIEDLVVTKVFSEDKVDGDPFAVSDAETMLRYLNPAARVPTTYTLFVRTGCQHCTRATDALRSAGLPYEVIRVNSGGSLSDGAISVAAMAAVAGSTSTPQVFANGKLIGGADELLATLSE